MDQNAENFIDISPCKMKEPFTLEEVTKAVTTMKNNKTPGIDQLRTEQLKYGPQIIMSIIAEILNKSVETGEKPNEISTGILLPLQKPGKKKGPCTNLRPIILFSVLRKILAICLINRIQKRVLWHLPKSQAAYQSGRSTTEHVFAYKLLAEKAITSSCYVTNIILMDMSKAFDNVHRATLIKDLQQIVQKDELHALMLLLDETQLTVRCGHTTGEYFKTNRGVPQGDCSSAILFILYLAKALRFTPQTNEHSYTKPEYLQIPEPSILHEHNYYIPKEIVHQKMKHCLTIDTEYADDIGKIIVSENRNCGKEIALSAYLSDRTLQCNSAKTEEFTITRHGNAAWKTCKYLGSLLDTENDLKRRKKLAMTSLLKLSQLWQSNKVTLNTKLRIFNACIRSIFLYNSELWTITRKYENKIDAFHRKLLRKVLNVKWPMKITNEGVYEKTNQQPWSKTISIQRLKWFGHALRLPETAPARTALIEAERRVPRPRGKPASTWISCVKRQLSELNVSWEEAKNVANDRKKWNDIVSKFCKNIT